MRVARLEWATFRVAFRAPFATAHGVETHRRGVLLRARLEDGTVGLGEASPLPSFGGEGLAAAELALAAAAVRLDGLDVEAALASLSAVPSAGARFGLETALLDGLGQVRGTAVAAMLGAGGRRRVAVNATVGVADARGAAEAAARAVQAGFRTVKLKVGTCESAGDEIARVEAVRAAIGAGARLRLDANAAWDVGAAVAILRACERLGIEMIEQPVAAGDLAGLAAVRRAIAIPVAADEAIGDEAAARAVLAADAADVLVVKPTIVGGLRAGRRIADLAAAAGRAVVVTTTLEAGVGVAACLHLAASLMAGEGASGPAHGLATAALLETDLLRSRLDVRDGEMRLPAGPGLGVELDENELARVGQAGWRQAARS